MKKVDFSDFSVKFWMFVTTLIMAVNLFFVLTLMNMAPQVHVIAQLLTPNVMNFGQAIEATSFSAPLGDKKLIEEMIVRFYLEQRNEVVPDVSEMSYRWGYLGPVRRLSSPRVYRNFVATQGDYKKSFRENKATQSVVVRDIRRQGNIFTVDFDLYVRSEGAMSRAFARRAIIAISESSNYRSFAYDFVNPFGTIISKYDETKVIQTRSRPKNRS